MKPEENQFAPLEENPSILKAVLNEPTDSLSETPQEKANVNILYKCRLSNFDTVVDENENKESPFSFTVGEGNVIKGLDVGIRSMRVGERAVFKIPPKFAYGE